MQERLGRGEFNKATTRVLHYVHNPEATVQKAAEQAQQETLQAENAALRANLQRLEAQVSLHCPCERSLLASCPEHSRS